MFSPCSLHKSALVCLKTSAGTWNSPMSVLSQRHRHTDGLSSLHDARSPSGPDGSELSLSSVS